MQHIFLINNFYKSTIFAGGEVPKQDLQPEPADGSEAAGGRETSCLKSDSSLLKNTLMVEKR